MKKTVSITAIALLIGLVFGLVMTGGGKQAIGQGNPQSLGQHHKELSFTVAPDQCTSTDGPPAACWKPMLPVADAPVLVLVSISGVIINGQLRPQNVFSATLLFDSTTGKLSGYQNLLNGTSNGVMPDYGYGFNFSTIYGSSAEPFISVSSNDPGANPIASAVQFHVSMWY